MSKNWFKIKTEEEAKILWDPYRLRISAIFRNSDEPMTVKQVADKMGEVPAKVHYHVQKLIKVGMLKLVKTENIRGITAKYYTNVYNGSDLVPEYFELKKVLKFIRNAHYNNFLTSVHNFYDSMLLTDEVFETLDEDKWTWYDSIQGFSKIYFTEQERDEFAEYISNFMRDKSKPGEGKVEFAMIFGITRTE